MRFGVAICAVLIPLSAVAQEADRDYLTAFLEDSLSDAGRKVVVTGFAGALSSQATLTELTIADDQGVWLTLRDVALDWSRSSLLSGEVVVNQLTAAEIVLDRMPDTGAGTTSPEAGSFALPELPVSIEIGKIAADHIVLGPTVLGTPLEARIEASLSLIGGEARATLLLERTDLGPDGKVALTASYANAGQKLAIDLQATEAAGGLAVMALDLPGAPSAAFTVLGNGPISDFVADVALATDGVDRLAGTVTLTGKDDGANAFSADLKGDLAPLFTPDYAEFFGTAVALQASGQRSADGQLDLESLTVSAKALQVQGSLALAADGLPQRFDLTGKIAAADGAPVLLPLTSDVETRVNSADLTLHYDVTEGENWAANITVAGLDRADFRASTLNLDGSGRIARVDGVAQVDASLRYGTEGLQPTDAALGLALGSVIWGEAAGSWRQGDGSFAVQKLTVSGEDYSATAAGAIAGLDQAFAITGKVEAKMADLSRLSGIAKRPLAGAAEVTVAGSVGPLTGAFDLVAQATGQDMKIGVPQVDRLLRGAAVVDASVKRDTNGTDLRMLKINAATLTMDAAGKLATAGSDIKVNLDFKDLSGLDGNYRGALVGKAQFVGTLDDGTVTLTATGRGLGVGQAEADKLLAGNSEADVSLSLKGGVVQVANATLRNPQIEARAFGTVAGSAQSFDITARLNNLALLLPQFPGGLSVTGTAVQDGNGLLLDLAGKGPGQIDATVKGRIAPGYSSGDLAIRGTAQAALANAFIGQRSISGQMGFDLRLNGPLRVDSLSGPVTLTEGRLADPGLKFALQGIAAKADLAGGRAAITADLGVTTGGRLAVTGAVGLTAPFAGDLAVAVQNVTLRDPDLYESTLNGAVTVTGPLLGGAAIAGRIGLSATEIRVPSTGFGGAGGLPGLTHVNEPKAVRDTRARAGLIDGGKAKKAAGPAFGLDIAVSAPSLFVRGRGLDAELGGELQLTGTTAAVVPVGSFNLIRGRLDILGKRLVLNEALMQMQGQLVPFLHITATTENDGITSGVAIDGPATDPVVTFTSSPELPQEEVLAQLLFGHSLQSLSAFQALQLANAVATLAGQGGEGVVSNLRKGFGLDNLDVQTNAAGGASLTAGKYLAKNLYSEVTVDQDGKSEINLNLDVSKSITLRARAGTDNTALGIVIEKDY